MVAGNSELFGADCTRLKSFEMLLRFSIHINGLHYIYMSVHCEEIRRRGTLHATNTLNKDQAEAVVKLLRCRATPRTAYGQGSTDVRAPPHHLALLYSR